MKITKVGINRFIQDKRGANMVEYIILVGIVALLAIVAFRTFNSSVKAKVEEQATGVTNIK